MDLGLAAPPEPEKPQVGERIGNAPSLCPDPKDVFDREQSIQLLVDEVGAALNSGWLVVRAAK